MTEGLLAAGFPKLSQNAHLRHVTLPPFLLTSRSYASYSPLSRLSCPSYSPLFRHFRPFASGPSESRFHCHLAFVLLQNLHIYIILRAPFPDPLQVPPHFQVPPAFEFPPSLEFPLTLSSCPLSSQRFGFRPTLATFDFPVPTPPTMLSHALPHTGKGFSKCYPSHYPIH